MPRTNHYRVWKGIGQRYRCACGALVQKRIDADNGKNVILNLAAPMIREEVDDKLRRFELFPSDALHWLTCARKKRPAPSI